ncbi:exopolysaccharide biosynthesis protein [Pseudotabrizicola algicola]|uniref:Exopolysaccharide biosynthesis protein n=1 Tax=Pseudotabrizicola algicola TaxID=2709381 RepID=A0A6B3RI30_9RHOB|nr:exopolysaccharide biosynthesis protein [Pseudotabrizicola algicola]NEX45650.1 exopolysaccharide biosynthesis protein [Pseudotabrizicola algicola]
MSANQDGAGLDQQAAVDPSIGTSQSARSGSDPQEEAADLNGVIAQLYQAARGSERVALGDLVDAMGRSSMAAVLLVPALLLISPVSGVPGASIVGGVVIALIAGQIVLRRHKVWLPEFIRNRTLPGPLLRKALVWLRKPARRFDGLAPAKPGGGEDLWWTPALAAVCLLLGLGMPMLELIPFSSSIVASLIAALALTMLTGRLTIALVAVMVAGIAATGVVWLV